MKIVIFLLFVSFSAFANENCASVNTDELEKCSYSEYKEQDDMLNYLYQTIVKSFPGIKSEVKDSQKLWIKSRDEICAYTPGDGSEYKISQNACMSQQTYERNRELKAIIAKEANRGVPQSMLGSKWNDYIKYHCEFMAKQFLDTGCKDRNQFLHSSQ